MPTRGSSSYRTTMLKIPRRETELSNIFGSLSILGFVDEARKCPEKATH